MQKWFADQPNAIKAELEAVVAYLEAEAQLLARTKATIPESEGMAKADWRAIRTEIGLLLHWMEGAIIVATRAIAAVAAIAPGPREETHE